MEQLMQADIDHGGARDQSVAAGLMMATAPRIDSALLARETLPFIALAATVDCLWDELRCLCLQLGCPAFSFIDLGAGISQLGPANQPILVDIDTLRHALAGAARDACLIDSQTLALPVFGPMGLEAAILVRLAVPERSVPGWTGHLAMACQLAYARYRQLAPRTPGGEAALSEREREIMQWVRSGKSNAVIATLLGISQSTVDTYMRRIFRKLEVADRTSAVMRAVALGVIA